MEASARGRRPASGARWFAQPTGRLALRRLRWAAYLARMPRSTHCPLRPFRPPHPAVLAAGAALMLAAARPAPAAHYQVFVVTGQSNALGTTNGGEAEVSPGADAADPRVRFFWHNVADAATSLGDSGGAWLDLQPQQGGYYPGSATHWGPEIGFARALVRAGVENVAVVKAARGGGGNSNWSKAAGGHMYAHVVATVTAAAAALAAEGHTFEIKGLLYLQGESDNAAEAEIAGTRFKELVDNLRADLPKAAGLTGRHRRDRRRRGRPRHGARAPRRDRRRHPLHRFFPNLDQQAEVTDGCISTRRRSCASAAFRGANFSPRARIEPPVRPAGLHRRFDHQGGNGDHPGYRYQVFKRLAEAACRPMPPPATASPARSPARRPRPCSPRRM
jgi:hypothetical protein